jgi:hypothetical protein
VSSWSGSSPRQGGGDVLISGCDDTRTTQYEVPPARWVAAPAVSVW